MLQTTRKLGYIYGFHGVGKNIHKWLWHKWNKYLSWLPFVHFSNESQNEEEVGWDRSNVGGATRIHRSWQQLTPRRLTLMHTDEHWHWQWRTPMWSFAYCSLFLVPVELHCIGWQTWLSTRRPTVIIRLLLCFFLSCVNGLTCLFCPAHVCPVEKTSKGSFQWKLRKWIEINWTKKLCLFNI